MTGFREETSYYETNQIETYVGALVHLRFQVGASIEQELYISCGPRWFVMNGTGFTVR